MRVTSTTGDASIRLLKPHTTLTDGTDVTLTNGEFNLTQTGFNRYFPERIQNLIEILYVPDGATWAAMLFFKNKEAGNSFVMRMSAAEYTTLHPKIDVKVLTSTVTHPKTPPPVLSWPGMSAPRAGTAVTTLPPECKESLLLESTPRAVTTPGDTPRVVWYDPTVNGTVNVPRVTGPVSVVDPPTPPETTAIYDPTAGGTLTGTACPGYWGKWASCTGPASAEKLPSCTTIASCAAAGSTSTTATASLVYTGTSVALRALTGATTVPGATAMYGTTGTGATAVTYVLSSPTANALTAKVIRKTAGAAAAVSVFDASRLSATGAPSLEWKVGGVSTAGTTATATTEQPVAAACADLRACLAQTPLDLAACAGDAQAASCAAAAPKSLVAAGSRLDHEGTKVDLYTLERALVGSDARGAFVVLPGASTTTKSPPGKMLFVAAGATKGALFDVLLDQTTKVWRAKKPDWVLIVGLIGGGVVLLLILVISLVYAFGKPHPYAQMM